MLTAKLTASEPPLVLIGEDGKKLLLEPGRMVHLGRGADNEFIVPADGASNHHARIEFRDGGPWLFDRGSKNGTTLNGIRVPASGALLKAGDRIGLGNAELRLLPAEPKKSDERSWLDSVTNGGPLGLGFNIQSAVDTVLCLTDGTVELKRGVSRDSSEYLLAMLMRAASVVTSANDPVTFLKNLLDLALDAVPARRGAVFLSGPGGPVPVQFKDLDSGSSKGFKISRSVLTSSIEAGRSVLVGEIAEPEAPMSQSFISSGLASVICVPIFSGEKTLGALYLEGTHSSPKLRQRDLELATVLATQIGICFENRRLAGQAMNTDRFATIGMAVSELAHDLANYLMKVSLLEQTVNEWFEDRFPGFAPEDWTALRAAIAATSAVVRDLQNVSRKKEPAWGIASPEATVNKVVGLCQPAAEQAKVELKASCALNGFATFYDPIWIERALGNLVKNAIEASPSGSQVRVTAELEPGGAWVRFTAADSGAGIRPEDQIRVLDPFFTSGKAQGTGLGLAIAQRIVVAHGGTLTFSSQVGAGTVFVMRLPVRTQRPRPANAATKAPGP